MDPTSNVRRALCYHHLPIGGNIYFWPFIRIWKSGCEPQKTEHQRLHLITHSWEGAPSLTCHSALFVETKWKFFFSVAAVCLSSHPRLPDFLRMLPMSHTGREPFLLHVYVRLPDWPTFVPWYFGMQNSNLFSQIKLDLVPFPSSKVGRKSSLHPFAKLSFPPALGIILEHLENNNV